MNVQTVRHIQIGPLVYACPKHTVSLRIPTLTHQYEELAAVNGHNGGGNLHVMMVFLWVRVNVLVYEMTPVGQTGFCSQTASCHNPITFPFPACPVVLLLCVLFKYHRITCASVLHACMHALTHKQTRAHTQRQIQLVTTLPPSMKYSFRQGIYTS